MTTPLARLQKSMIEKNLTYYLIPSEDPHQSEYVDDHYKCRQFISGFTGSSGAVLAEQAESRLWTDGRYFTQAEAQIDPEQMKLMKMGVSGVPTILEYLTEHLSEGDVLSLNGRMINTAYGRKLSRLAASKKAVLETIILSQRISGPAARMPQHPRFLSMKIFMPGNLCRRSSKESAAVWRQFPQVPILSPPCLISHGSSICAAMTCPARLCFTAMHGSHRKAAAYL